MEDIGLSFIEPTWSMMDQFVHDKLYSAFNYDQSSFSHPVSVALQDPKNLADILDTLSYAKVWTKDDNFFFFLIILILFNFKKYVHNLQKYLE